MCTCTLSKRLTMTLRLCPNTLSFVRSSPTLEKRPRNSGMILRSRKGLTLHDQTMKELNNESSLQATDVTWCAG